MQAKNKNTGIYAAAKVIEIKDQDEIEDFLVEIQILSDCTHHYIVGLYETYLFANKLWVSWAEGGCCHQGYSPMVLGQS